MSIVIFFILTTIGIYLVLSDILKLPKFKASKKILDINKRDSKNRTKSLDVICLEYATKLSKYIKLDDYKKDKLEITLRSAQIKLTPETYVANVYIKTLLVVLFIPITIVISPIISFIMIAFAILIYLKEINRADAILLKRKKWIEYELPKFAMTIEQELKSSRDIFSILESYQRHNKSSLSKELEITIADMRSGSYEEALRRLETRVGSSKLSEIIRGLIGVINGNDEQIYFRILAQDLKELEFQRLRGIALKRPDKVKKYSAMMLSCLMLLYGVVLGYEIVKGLSSMF